VDNVLRYIQFKAFGRAFRGYHTAWLVVGAAAWMINRARHREDVIYRTLLKPGERLVVTASRRGSAPFPGDD
jgi:hypothetical protein